MLSAFVGTVLCALACKSGAGDAPLAPAPGSAASSQALPAARSAASGSATAAPPVSSAAALGTAVDALPNSTAASEAAELAPSPAPALRAHSDPRAGEVIAVAAGSAYVGSFPGEDGRDPLSEAPATKQDLPAFEIDALPYPNDPSAAPRVNVGRAEAAKLCADRAARLCTEAEWERACRGSEGGPYASGATWDRSCEREGVKCTSPLGVRMLGVLREWTQTRPVADRDGDAASSSVIKGATPLPANYRYSQGAHRCGRRAKLGDNTALGDLGFRCCKGPATEVPLAPLPRKEPAFAKRKLTSAELAAMLKEVPELGRLAGDIRLNDVGDAHVIETKGSVPARKYVITTEPVVWNPEAGSEVLVVTGRARNASFIVALYPVAGDRARIASYFLMLGDVVPIALAYQPDRRSEILWTTCWGCYGDHGRMSLRDDHRVVIVQDPSNTKDEATP